MIRRRALLGLLVTGVALSPGAADAATTPKPTPSATTKTLPVPRATVDPTVSVGGPQLASMGLVTDLPPGVPAPPTLRDVSWVLADLGTGKVVAAKAAHARLLPASTLKALTALTLIPEIPARQKITVTQSDANADGTRVGSGARTSLHGRAAVPGPAHGLRQRRRLRARRSRRRAGDDADRHERAGGLPRGARHGRQGPVRPGCAGTDVERLRPGADRPGSLAARRLPHLRHDQAGRLPGTRGPQDEEALDLQDQQPQQAALQLRRHHRGQERLHRGSQPHLHLGRDPWHQDLPAHRDVRARLVMASAGGDVRLGVRLRGQGGRGG